jgi:hypothetical protein
MIDDLNIIISLYVCKYRFSFVLKDIKKRRYDVLFGDFGGLYRNNNNTYIIINNIMMRRHVYKYIENYITRFNRCNNHDKYFIKNAFESYEKNLNGLLLQRFPFNEWIEYPMHVRSIFKESELEFIRNTIIDYYIRPYYLKLKWRNLINC